ncbi:hypothetical protein [Roseiflexus sp.]
MTAGYAAAARRWYNCLAVYGNRAVLAPARLIDEKETTPCDWQGNGLRYW